MNEEHKKAADKKSLVETDGLAHRRLDVQRLDVLPVLLEERHQEVDTCTEPRQQPKAFNQNNRYSLNITFAST